MTLVPIRIAVLKVGSTLIARKRYYEKNRKCAFSYDIHRNQR